MKTLTLTVTEIENGDLEYDIVSDGFKKIEVIGIIQEAQRLVFEKEKSEGI